MLAYFCAICDKWYNYARNFESYEVIFCPACKKEGETPLFFTSKPYFSTYRILLEVLTEIAGFIDKEIRPIFETFEVVK